MFGTSQIGPSDRSEFLIVYSSSCPFYWSPLYHHCLQFQRGYWFFL